MLAKIGKLIKNGKILSFTLYFQYTNQQIIKLNCNKNCHFRVYCKYHVLEAHEFDSPESELRHFLNKLEDPSWDWSEQYKENENSDKGEFLSS